MCCFVKFAVRDAIASASRDLDAGFKWTRQVVLPDTSDKDLLDSGEFASLDAKLAVAGMSPTPTGDVTETSLRVQLGRSVALRDITSYCNRLAMGHVDKNYMSSTPRQENTSSSND